MTQVDCSAYDYSCASSRMRGAYEAYPLHRPPGEISDTLSLDSDGGAAFRKRVLERLVSTNAPAAAPSRRWWLAATASDDGAVQISKDPEKTRRALEASRFKSTATPYSSSTGMGRLMYIFMFLYLFLERAGNPLDFAMMGRGFQGSRA